MSEILAASERDEVLQLLRASLGPCTLRDVHIVQTLWGGYGRILRCHLGGVEREQVIVKWVRWPATPRHPRGWATDLGHVRKVRSYQVESQWYNHFGTRVGMDVRVPAGIQVGEVEGGVFLVLEDLHVSGFTGRADSLARPQVQACLSWLARFHAACLGMAPKGLWPVGTYWHLATRPDELEVMPDGPLKDAASVIDHRLSAATYQTIVHGDAKDANFCFHASRDEVAAVDFQYVGGGCGMKDVAYFFSSCLDETELARDADDYLTFYFSVLRASLESLHPALPFAALEAEWRALYPIAWADFARFLLGWSPGHRKLHGYTARMTESALRAL